MSQDNSGEESGRGLWFDELDGPDALSLTPELNLVVAVVKRSVLDFGASGVEGHQYHLAAAAWFRECSFDPWGFGWASEVLAPEGPEEMRRRVLLYASAERKRRRDLLLSNGLTTTAKVRWRPGHAYKTIQRGHLSSRRRPLQEPPGVRQERRLQAVAGVRVVQQQAAATVGTRTISGAALRRALQDDAAGYK